MDKILKLVNLKSFIAKPTRGIVIKKGEVAKFDGPTAKKLLTNTVKLKGEDVPCFEEVEGVSVDHDFTIPVEVDEDADADAEKATPAAATRSQRTRRATA